MHWKYYKPKFEYEEKFKDEKLPWAGHKYFGYDLIRNVKPEIIVELGTYKGTSFFSFCQAVKDEKLDSKLYAVDTWEGDDHGGFYDNSIFENVKEIIASFYLNRNIELKRKTFDNALAEFEDNSIDILHIDGLHTYEAVKHDFESWFPKVKKDGIILFHDMNVKIMGFGVCELWEELKKKYQTIEFHQSNGLGVLFKNAEKYKDLLVLNEFWFNYYSMAAEKRVNEFDFEVVIKEMGSALRDLEQQKDKIIKQKNEELHEIRSSLRWKIPNFIYKLYKNKLKKYIPKFVFALLNFVIDLLNRKELKYQENKKCISKVLEKRIKDIDSICFKKYSKPRVSIIIPVYNKWQFTYNCLKSLKNNTSDIEYEVIVVDNASTDETDILLEKIKNVKYIKNKNNKGFAKACNQGAREAVGEYILFLNNDTVARKDWLSPLIDELDNNEKTFIVGNKLLFPNNTIQHAGIAFAEDKIPRHLFYRADENDHRTNKRKLFNAVTGACLMILKRAFIEVDGFDENFMNGLEDIDLCLKVRELGGEIVYRPDSVMYHYESISEGRFNYTNENIELFLEKWKNKIISDQDELNK